MAYIISADDIKQTLPGYRPENAELFHAASAKQADRLYAEAVKTSTEAKVILMSGGAASGKTEYVSAYLAKETAIVVDGTLPTLRGATIKIQRAQRANKTIEINAVIPKSLPVAFDAFLHRDRKFASEHFYRTHSSSRRTLLEIARTMPKIPIKIFQSTITFTGAAVSITFRALSFTNRQALIEFLERNQYTQEEMRTITLQS